MHEVWKCRSRYRRRITAGNQGFMYQLGQKVLCSISRLVAHWAGPEPLKPGPSY
jgi:hypothetical protein